MATALYERMPTPEQMAAIGLTPEDFEHDVVEVWPENWDSVQFFVRLQTQWRIGMAGATGLDYAAVLALLRSMRLPRDRADEIFADVQVMERAALVAMHKK